MHKKLEEIGMTEEILNQFGIGAILFQKCPKCKSDIFYQIQGDYYKLWKETKKVPMILYCGTCEGYTGAKASEGTVLYEKEGKIIKRENIPFIENIPNLF